MKSSLKLKYINPRLEVLKPAIEKFLSKISVVDNGCWEWSAVKNQYGYAQFKLNDKIIYAHRFIYEYYHGVICPDLTIDHLCRNRKCVNPLHLEQVTHKENILRGVGITAINSKKTHCPQGHKYDNENTYHRVFRGNIGRGCKKCSRKRVLKYRLKYPERYKKMTAINYTRWYKKRQQARLK